jgi:hypothetical protein
VKPELRQRQDQPIQSPEPEIVPTEHGYLWVSGNELHELFLAFGTVHVRTLRR